MARIVCDGRFDGARRKALLCGTHNGLRRVAEQHREPPLLARCHRDSKRNSPADLPDQQPMSDTARNPNDIDLHQLLWLSEDRSPVEVSEHRLDGSS